MWHHRYYEVVAIVFFLVVQLSVVYDAWQLLDRGFSLVVERVSFPNNGTEQVSNHTGDLQQVALNVTRSSTLSLSLEIDREGGRDLGQQRSVSLSCQFDLSQPHKIDRVNHTNQSTTKAYNFSE